VEAAEETVMMIPPCEATWWEANLIPDDHPVIREARVRPTEDGKRLERLTPTGWFTDIWLEQDHKHERRSFFPSRDRAVTWVRDVMTRTAAKKYEECEAYKRKLLDWLETEHKRYAEEHKEQLCV